MFSVVVFNFDLRVAVKSKSQASRCTRQVAFFWQAMHVSSIGALKTSVYLTLSDYMQATQHLVQALVKCFTTSTCNPSNFIRSAVSLNVKLGRTEIEILMPSGRKFGHIPHALAASPCKSTWSIQKSFPRTFSCYGKIWS